MAYPHRVVYHATTGKIQYCRPMSAQAIQKNMELNPELDYITAYCADINNCVIDLTTKQMIDNSQPKEYTHWMRTRRNKELSMCDWTQGADSPLSDAKKAEWAAYRQALRDLPANCPDCIDCKDSVTWPTKPE